jgi:hypothetical protein
MREDAGGEVVGVAAGAGRGSGGMGRIAPIGGGGVLGWRVRWR